MARPPETDEATRRVRAELERRQLLLQAGNEFPSIATIVVGEPIRGSWWAHPQSNLIYWVCQDLDDDPNVTEARLIGGKVTHVWRTAWADVASVALAREPWQSDGLDAAERALIDDADAADVRADALVWTGRRKLADACRLLERRLLVKAHDVHTDSGRHVKVLGSWRRWWQENGTGRLHKAADARARLEQLVGNRKLLPWDRKSRSGDRSYQ
jgi:hypothetical protein